MKKYNDSQLEKFWEQFGNIYFDNNEKSDENFLHFEKGTDKFTIWHWFDINHSKGLAKGLMFKTKGLK